MLETEDGDIWEWRWYKNIITIKIKNLKNNNVIRPYETENSGQVQLVREQAFIKNLLCAKHCLGSHNTNTAQIW